EAVEIEGPVEPRQTRHELECGGLGDCISLQPGRVDGLDRHRPLALTVQRTRRGRAGRQGQHYGSGQDFDHLNLVWETIGPFPRLARSLVGSGSPEATAYFC